MKTKTLAKLRHIGCCFFAFVFFAILSSIGIAILTHNDYCPHSINNINKIEITIDKPLDLPYYSAIEISKMDIDSAIIEHITCINCSENWIGRTTLYKNNIIVSARRWGY